MIIILGGPTALNERGQQALAAHHNVPIYMPSTLFNSLLAKVSGKPIDPATLPQPGAASQLYSELNLNGSTTNKLYLVQLEADGQFQDLSNYHRTAKHLIERGLSTLVKDIYLVISDVPSKRPLHDYADRLVEALGEKGFELHIKTCSSKDYPVTFICPPETPDGQWQIFGIQQENDPAPEPPHGLGKILGIPQEAQPTKALGYEAYSNHPAKTLLWEGKNIDEWFDNPERTYVPMFR